MGKFLALDTTGSYLTVIAADGDRQWSEKKMGELQQLFNMFQSKGGTFQGM